MSVKAAKGFMNNSVISVGTIERKLGTGLHNGLFSLITGGVLLITGAAKIWSAFGNVKLLLVTDPIIGIQFRYLMFVVGVAELAVAFVCLFTARRRLAMLLVAWLATGFLMYRVGLWWVEWESPCPCLGNLTDLLRLPPNLADNIMNAVLAYLLIGSYALLFQQWRQQDQTPGPSPIATESP